jgi:hypothetical protein
MWHLLLEVPSHLDYMEKSRATVVESAIARYEVKGPLQISRVRLLSMYLPRLRIIADTGG